MMRSNFSPSATKKIKTMNFSHPSIIYGPICYFSIFLYLSRTKSILLWIFHRIKSRQIRNEKRRELANLVHGHFSGNNVDILSKQNQNNNLA